MKIEYDKLTDIELIECINSLKLHPKTFRVALSHRFPELYLELKKRTCFLNTSYTETKEVSIFARIYCLEHGLTAIPLCARDGCTNHVHWNNDNRTFHRFCSNKCKANDANWKEEVKRTTIEHHGGVGFASLELAEKSHQTLLERTGYEHQMHNPETRKKSMETNNRKYGTDWAIASESVKNKMVDTCLKKFGYDNYAKSPEYHKNKKRKFHSDKYPGLTFDSTWEVIVYEFCMDNNIPVEYSPSISISYEYDGDIHFYYPDFLINGKIYEVKGDNFFRINESTGNEEMICPYRDEDWSDEQYAWVCGKFEAKHQCMLANGVIILRGSDIKELENAKSGETITFLQISNHNQ